MNQIQNDKINANNTFYVRKTIFHQILYNIFMENLEQVKKAVEIEVKHRYININGRTKSFSSFICSVLRKEIKQNPENPKWKVLLEHFERYPLETVPARRKSLERFVAEIGRAHV